MKNLDSKVIFVFFIKNFFGTAYIIPFWFFGAYIHEQFWTKNTDALTRDIISILVFGAGLIFLILLMFGCYYWSMLTYINFTYELQPDGLHIYHGVIIKRHTVIPYKDIKAVEILLNPIVYRYLQVLTLRIQTLEIVNTEGVMKKKKVQIIPGISSEEARFLRPELLKNSHINVKNNTFTYYQNLR